MRTLQAQCPGNLEYLFVWLCNKLALDPWWLPTLVSHTWFSIPDCVRAAARLAIFTQPLETDRLSGEGGRSYLLKAPAEMASLWPGGAYQLELWLGQVYGQGICHDWDRMISATCPVHNSVKRCDRHLCKYGSTLWGWSDLGVLGESCR